MNSMMFINGQFAESRGREVYDIINPANGRVVGRNSSHQLTLWRGEAGKLRFRWVDSSRAALVANKGSRDWNPARKPRL